MGCCFGTETKTLTPRGSVMRMLSASESTFDPFMHFCDDKQCDENVRFLEEYTTILTIKDDTRLARIAELKHKYIEVGSESEINLSWKMRQAILKADINDPPEQVFGDAVAEIYLILRFGAYRTFYKTTHDT
jgi:hypothetical protein